MIKLLKNTTASIIFLTDVGIRIPANGTYLITTQEYLLWAASTDYQSLVTSGDIVVNNGTIDLSAADGIRYIEYADRSLVQNNGTDVTQVATTLNFIGSVTVADDGNGKATINVGSSATLIPALREVTMVVIPGVGEMNILSNLLFEPDPINDTILFLQEEIQ